MTLARAGFNLLYFFASCDGDVHEKELKVIKSYLEKNYKQDFDPVSEIKKLCALDNEAATERLSKAAYYIKEHGDPVSLKNLLIFALRLISSDGSLSEKETELFSIVGSIWNIDIRSFLQENQNR